MTSTRRTYVMDSGSVIILDRDLPVPVGTQIRGQIEYGIATGEISAGAKLPSVRDLASGLGVAPVTIVQVYKELQGQELLESQHGRGTFVPDRRAPHPKTENLGSLFGAVDALFEQGRDLGFSAAQVSEAVSLRSLQAAGEDTSLHVLFVGIYREATDAYVASIRPRLRPLDTIDAAIFEDFGDDASSVPGADLYITFAHREAALRELLGPDAPVVITTFIPTQQTRTQLASLEPDTRLTVVAGVSGFLPTLQRHVAQFASHVPDFRAVLRDSEAIDEALGWCDALVYATGTQDVLESIRADVTAFEFRYEPDPHSIHQALLTTLESLRKQRSATETA